MQITERRLRCPKCGSPVTIRITGFFKSDGNDPRPWVELECFCASLECTYDVIYEEVLEVPNAVVKED